MDRREIIHSFFHNRAGVLATMHKKEKVMAPQLEQKLGIMVKVPKNIDTDQFGTFTRDVDRSGNQLEAARHKAERALQLTNETLAISSEGIFGPHPFFPILPYNREIVLLIDLVNDFEIIGESSSTDTNFAHQYIHSFDEAFEFAQSVGFPEHAVVAKLSESTKNQDEIIKGIHTSEALEKAVQTLLAKSQNNKIFIETDMRAFCNPTRMENIKHATQDLIHKIYNLCPECSFPGFEVFERKKGLLCEWCGFPTPLIKSEIYQCKKCGTQEEKLYPNGKEKADPSQCSICNP